jgi:hypothetical protein
MVIKKVTRLNACAQSATEYLLTLAAILIAFSGIVVLFSNQLSSYLAMLFKVLALPF